MGNVYICYLRHLAHFFKGIIQILLTTVVIQNPHRLSFFFWLCIETRSCREPIQRYLWLAESNRSRNLGQSIVKIEKVDLKQHFVIKYFSNWPTFRTVIIKFCQYMHIELISELRYVDLNLKILRSSWPICEFCSSLFSKLFRWGEAKNNQTLSVDSSYDLPELKSVTLTYFLNFHF